MLRFYYVTTYLTIGDKTFTLPPSLYTKTAMIDSKNELKKETIYSGNTFDSLFELQAKGSIMGIDKYVKRYLFSDPQKTIKVFDVRKDTFYHWKEKQGNQDWRIWEKYEYFKPNLEHLFKHCSIEEVDAYLKDRGLECLSKFYHQ